mmetsp:Transcript_950/g.2000  ORF Transcript_950/g.2000 Transcript_950/m.2000 type:complete len:206 (+) Transcript_950:150-767(+)
MIVILLSTFRCSDWIAPISVTSVPVTNARSDGLMLDNNWTTVWGASLSLDASSNVRYVLSCEIMSLVRRRTIPCETSVQAVSICSGCCSLSKLSTPSLYASRSTSGQETLTCAEKDTTVTASNPGGAKGGGGGEFGGGAGGGGDGDGGSGDKDGGGREGREGDGAGRKGGSGRGDGDGASGKGGDDGGSSGGGGIDGGEDGHVEE